MRKQKVAIIGTNGLPGRYGGFETLTEYLTIYLHEEFDILVYCSSRSVKKGPKVFNGARLLYLPFKANGYQSVLYDIICIIHAWFTADTLLILGNSGALIFPFKFITGKRIILNIGGIDWARNKWSFWTRQFIRFSEWMCVKFSDIVITDNKHIQQLYKDKYNCDSVLIEYGGNHVHQIPLKEETLIKYQFLRQPYILSVSRAQRDNNIHLLLEAFIKIPSRNLVVISNWQFSEYGNELITRYRNKYKNIHMIDAIYDLEILDQFRSNASLYIHSHSFCGTAPSLVEEMHLSVPIICFRSETNIETTENKGVYFDSIEELLLLLKNITEEEKESLVKNMKEIAERRYTWERISSLYANCLRN